MIKFIINKTKDFSIKYILFLEIEALIITITSLIPTRVGMVIRWLILKLLAKKTKGFQWIKTNVIIEHSDRISFGENVGINCNCYINGFGGLEIGNYVLLGTSITITTGAHPSKGKGEPTFYKRSVPKKTIIEDDVWIGSNCVILPGVKLKKGCIIGANSVVTKDTEKYAIYAGAPAKKISER